MAPRYKHPCACGCTLYVTRGVELGHLNGRRSAVLAANVLTQNRLLLRSRRQASKLQLILSPHRSRKRELIGRSEPLRRELSSRKASRPDRHSSENSFRETGDEYNNLLASEAGPSGVSPHMDLDMSADRSPTPDLPPPRSSPMLILPDADVHDQYGLSTQRRSHRIAERVDRIGQVRWGANHVQIIEREEREEDDEELSVPGGMDGEDGMRHDDDELEVDDDELEDEEDMPFAEPGQEGISVWDLLGDGFLKEVADLGNYF